MNLKTTISEKIDENHWIKTLEAHPASTIYQIPVWCKTYKEVFNSKPFFIEIKNQDEQIVGQLALLIHSNYFWEGTNKITKIFTSKTNLGKHIFWNYGPIIHDNENFEEIFSKILDVVDELAIKHKVSFIRGSTPPMMNQPSKTMLESYDYQLSMWSTYITDLKSNTTDFFDSLNKSVRYDIRKAQKNKLEFVVGDDFSSLSEYGDMKYNAKSRSGHRKGKVPFFYEREWENLHRHGFAKIFLSKHEQIPLSGILCLIFNQNVVQHGAVNSPNTKLQGGTFVTWSGIKWCMENGLKTFDMAGVNPNPSSKKEEQIDFFKSKWGGKKYDYFTFIKILDQKKARISFALQDPKKILARINPT